MADQFKAKVSFDKRTVLISLGTGGRGSVVAPRLKKRLNAYKSQIELLDRQAGETQIEFLQRVEEVADLIVLLDDELCEALNDAPSEPNPAEFATGQELVVALHRNEKASNTVLPRVRIWLARVDELDLDALSAIARGRWNLTRADIKRWLHWLYQPTERVTLDKVENGIFSDADDMRLGERIRNFREHRREQCSPCGGQAPAAPAGDQPPAAPTH